MFHFCLGATDGHIKARTVRLSDMIETQGSKIKERNIDDELRDFAGRKEPSLKIYERKPELSQPVACSSHHLGCFGVFGETHVATH